MRKLQKGKKAYTSMPMTVKGVDKEKGRLTMVASTQSVDRHGDTIVQAGWDLKPFKKNPVILNSHNYYDATEVIARAENTRIEGKGKRAKLLQDWVFAIEENPKAKIIFDLYAGGFLHASSVGFIPRKFAEKDDGSRDWYVIDEAELLEVSAVSVPANAEATLAKAAAAIGADLKDVREALKFTEGEPQEPEEDEDEEPQDEPEEPKVPKDDEVVEPEPEKPGDEEEPEEDDEKPEEKRARLQGEREKIDAELKDMEDEDEGDDTMIDHTGKANEKVSPKRRYLKAIHSINEREARAYRKATDIINSILNGDEDGKTLDRKTREKVKSRKVNKAIRILIANK